MGFTLHYFSKNVGNSTDSMGQKKVGQKKEPVMRKLTGSFLR